MTLKWKEEKNKLRSAGKKNDYEIVNGLHGDNYLNVYSPSGRLVAGKQISSTEQAQQQAESLEV